MAFNDLKINITIFELYHHNILSQTRFKEIHWNFLFMIMIISLLALIDEAMQTLKRISQFWIKTNMILLHCPSSDWNIRSSLNCYKTLFDSKVSSYATGAPSWGLLHLTTSLPIERAGVWLFTILPPFKKRNVIKKEGRTNFYLY